MLFRNRLIKSDKYDQMWLSLSKVFASLASAQRELFFLMYVRGSNFLAFIVDSSGVRINPHAPCSMDAGKTRFLCEHCSESCLAPRDNADESSSSTKKRIRDGFLFYMRKTRHRTAYEDGRLRRSKTL